MFIENEWEMASLDIYWIQENETSNEIIYSLKFAVSDFVYHKMMYYFTETELFCMFYVAALIL